MTPYHPLNENEFRLLHVNYTSDGAIQGQLEHFTLPPAKGMYTAISYVWGESAAHESIKVNGCDFKVTRNAFTILKMFCDLPKSRDKTWIWLDSVCIDQKNAVEKSIQVSRMSGTYESAIRVFVWLGEGNEQTDRGIELMRMLALHISGYPVPKSILKDAKAWDGYREVALRPWWRRVWTLQESTIPDDAIYYCGTKCLTGSQLRGAILYLYEFVPPEIDEIVWQPLWNRRRCYQWLEDSEFVSLPALLAYGGYASASDPRDYIYSLLGCIRMRDKKLIGAPRYNVDVDLVYLDFIRDWIIEYQSLDVVSFASLFREDLASAKRGLPSWVPNWQERTTAHARESNPIPLLVSQPCKLVIGGLMPPRFARFLNKDLGPDCPLYNASGDMPLEATFTDDSQSITCTGIVLGNIDGLAAMASALNEPMLQSTAEITSFNAYHHDNSTIEIAKAVILSLMFGRADVYLQYEADSHAIMTELAAMRPSSGSSKKNARAFQDWLEANGKFLIRGQTLRTVLTSVLQDFSSEDVDSHMYHLGLGLAGRRAQIHHLSRGEYQSSVPDSTKETLAQEEDQGRRHPFLRKFKYATHPRWMARRLCTTDKGGIGMVSKDSQRNDLVCVLFGCSVPVVLRRTGHDRYLFVGESYMHGYMEGQAVKAEYKTQTFVLV